MIPRPRIPLVCLALAASCLAVSPHLWAAQIPKVETLENGLKVALVEDHASPLVAVAVWVHVGGKDESDQVPGFSHFLERLIPLGTKKRAPHQQSLEIFQAGGISDIQSDYDRTYFFALVPKESLDRALEDLFQQVTQADLSDAAIAKMRPLITRELKDVYDDSSQVLLLEQMRAAFPGQPYRIPYFGSFDSLAHLEHTTASSFYGNFYVANNMVVAVSGDLAPSPTLEKIRKLFGTLKPSKALPAKPKFDSGFNGGRQIVKNLGDFAPSVSLLFPTPGYRHPDRLPLAALARLLDGSAAPQLVKEEGTSGRLAVSASFDFHLLEERGLLAFTAYPVTLQAVPATGQAMAGALAKIRNDGLDEAEVAQVLQAMRLEAAVRRNTVGSLTQELAEGLLFGDARYAWNLDSDLAKLTSQDIRRVASTYLVGDNAVTLIVLPKGEDKPSPQVLEQLASTVAHLTPAEGKAAPPEFAANAYAADKAPMVPRAERRPFAPATRKTLDNGMTVILKPAPGSGIVAVSLQIRAGFGLDPAGKEGVAQMVAASLPLGSGDLSAAELRNRAAALGSTFGVSLSIETMETGLTVFSENLQTALDLLSSAVRSPSFAEADLPKIRARLARYREAQSRGTQQVAQELAREKIFRSHPYARPSLPGDAALQAIGREDLVSFHKSAYQPGRAVLTLVGDFRPDSALAGVETAFGKWSSTANDKKGLEVPEAGEVDPSAGEFSRLVDATSSDLLLAYPGVSLKDSQFPILRALGTILSAKGYVDLVLNQPMAYSVRSGLDGFSRSGMLTLEANVPATDTSQIAYELMLRARALGLREVAPETIRDVKSVERGRLLREKQVLYTQASNLGYYELVGPGFAIYDEGKTLPAEMSAAALKEAAARYLDTARLVRVVAGPPAR